MDQTDLLVVGAGPCGLAVGVAAKQAGLSCVLLDRRTIVSTIERYPLSMTFFSTPERIEIGGDPVHRQPREAHPAGRADLLSSGGRALRTGCPARPRRWWMCVREADGGFRVEVRRQHDEKAYRAGAVVFATGYYDNPNYLRIPGEELPHVASLLLRGPSLLAPAGGGDRGGEQQRGRGARVLAGGGDRDPGALRRGVRQDGQGLGAARHRQPGEGGQHRGPLALPGPCDHADRGRDRERGDGDGRVPSDRRRARHDRLPRGHHDAPAARRAGGSGDRDSGPRRGDDGDAAPGRLPRGCDRQRQRRQPAVHRELPGTWEADRAGPARDAAGVATRR